MNVSFVMHPCPALLDENGTPYGPIRTNFFPQPQLTLCSTLTNSQHHCELLDLRTIADPSAWPSELNEPYAASIVYGGTHLSRYLIADYRERIAVSSRDIDVYVLSSNFTYEAAAVCHTIAELRRHNPRATVLVGGCDASPAERHAFYRRHGADYIGIGDGDLSLPDFLAALESGDAAARCPDRLIAARGRIHTIDLSLLHRLHHDPSRFAESGGGDVLPSVIGRGFAAYIEMQRGCNRTCEFCSAASTPFDRLTVAEMQQQIDNYLHNGVSLFMFTDDNTLLQRKADLLEVFGYLRDSGAVWEFPNGLEFGLLRSKDRNGCWYANDDLIDALFWNNGRRDEFRGAHRALMPVEDSLLRRSTLLKLRGDGSEEMLEQLLARGLPFLNMGIMIGSLTEGLDEHRNLQRNLAGLAAIVASGRTTVNFSIFCTMPLPGTVLGRDICASGRLRYDIDECPELWNVFVSVMDGDTFSCHEITRIRRSILAEYRMEQVAGKVHPLPA